MDAKKGFSGEIILALTAVIWGAAFVAQSLGADSLESFSYNSVRFFIGALTLVPVIIMRVRRKTAVKCSLKHLLIGGALCGTALFAASYLQQSAIAFTDASGDKSLVGKVGFLTALYIVLVPVIGIFFGKKTDLRTWISVAIAAAGMALITDLKSLTIGTSDLMAIACAVMFSFQITFVDMFCKDMDSVKLSCVQFTVAALLSGICALIFESPTLEAALDGKWSILYVGVMSSGVAYTLQIVGQKRTKPQTASLIMSLESVFSLLFGFIILNERLSLGELCGCALMLCAVVLTQVKKK